MKALIGIDGSSDSQEAVRQAAQLLSPERDTVALYYSPPTVKVSGTVPSPEITEKARDALTKSVFEDARSLLPEGFHASLETITGTHDPRQGLLAAANRVRADMIAVGARGTAPLQRLLLGSVSRAVLNNSRIPVLVARKDPHAHVEGFKILWADDATDAGAYVAEFLHQLTWPEGATAHVITVVEPIVPGDVPHWIKPEIRDPEIKRWVDEWDKETEAKKNAKLAVLNLRCKSMSNVFQNAKCEVLEGYPADKILETINREKVDLVIMGARRMSAISRLMLGSTSEAVLSHSPCSVLVVREVEQP